MLYCCIFKFLFRYNVIEIIVKVIDLKYSSKRYDFMISKKGVVSSLILFCS